MADDNKEKEGSLQVDKNETSEIKPDLEMPALGAGLAFREEGVTGLRQSGGYVYEEFLPKLRWPMAGEVYQEMSSNDPVVTAILLCSRQLIRNVFWSVEAASSSKEDMEAAEFLKTCMNDLNMPWSSIIDDIMSFFEYGWSYCEIIYKKRDGQKGKCPSKYNDQRIGWRKIAGRSQTSLSSWEIDEYGSIRGMHQYTDTPKGTVFIPIEKALLFRTTTARNNPEGKSFLRGAYRPWYFKKHIEEVEGIGVERDLAGLPVLTAPQGLDLFDETNPKAVETKNTAMRLVSSIRRDRNEGVVLSYGWDLKLLSSSSARQFDTNSIINRYDQRIAITMLSDIVMMGGDKVGSFALAKTKQSILAAALDAQLANVVEILNTVAVPRLFALNTFKNLTDYPKFKVTSVISPDLQELGGYITALANAQMPLFPDIDLENYLRRLVQFPDVTSDEQAREDQLNIAYTKGGRKNKGTLQRLDEQAVEEEDTSTGTQPSEDPEDPEEDEATKDKPKKKEAGSDKNKPKPAKKDSAKKDPDKKA